MKNFVQTFFASLLAVVVASVFVGFLSVVIMAGTISTMSISTTSKPVVVKDSTVLVVDMKTVFEEGVYQNQFGNVSLEIESSLLKVNKVNYLKALDVIRFAAKDNKIIAMRLNPNGMSLNMAQMVEFREVLAEFAKEKPIYVYADTFNSLGEYYISSVSDSIMLSRLGSLPWWGLASGGMFYKGLFDKFGIDAEVFRCGKFKSAVEPYTEKKMSDENRKQTELMLNTIWGYILNDVAKSRGLDSAKLQQLASDLAIATSKDVVNHGFVDRIGGPEQASEMLYNLYGGNKKMLKTVSLKNYMSTFVLANKGKKSQNVGKNKVVVIQAEGAIMPIAASSKNITPGDMLSKLKSVEKDSTIKAVVIRVNSPGGSALDSEIICSQVEKLRKVKPVVISMSAYAASGGYYISALADRIVASPLTLTGSIGVFSVAIDPTKALNKLGITFDVVKTNKSSDIGFGSMTPAHRNFLQKSIDEVYTLFKERVATGRNMTLEQVESIASGRVWTGIEAKRVGLVDELGGLREAILIAAKLSGIENNYTLSLLPNKDDSMDKMVNMLKKFVKIDANIQRSVLDEYIERVKAVMNMSGKVMALSPVVFNIE